MDFYSIAVTFWIYVLPFFILVNPDLDEATGQNDAGVAMLNAYNYVHDQSSSTDGLAFITSCYNKVSEIEFCLELWQNIAGFLCLFGNFVDLLKELVRNSGGAKK